MNGVAARPWRLVVLCFGALTMAACGATTTPGPLHATTPDAATATPTATPLATLPPGLLASGADWVDFLQVIQTGGSVSGTFTYYEYQPQGTSHVAQGVDDVSGFITGMQVQLSIGSATYTDTLTADGSLELSVTESDGTISVEDFVPASIGQYNLDVAPIQSLVQEWTVSYWGGGIGELRAGGGHARRPDLRQLGRSADLQRRADRWLHGGDDVRPV